MNKVERFNFILEGMTSASQCKTNLEIVQFHCFNYHGKLAKKKINDNIITNAVELGKVPSGAIMAHGSMDDYIVKRLQKLADKKRVNRMELICTLSSLDYQIQKANKFIEEEIFNGNKN